MNKKLKFLVSAGPTREYIDPIRFLTNASSGKMGYAIAEAIVAAGHECYLVAGPVELDDPAGVMVEHVVSASDMKKAICNEFVNCDVLVMTAAVADYRPVVKHDQKMHKSSLTLAIELEQNPDIIREIKRWHEKQIIVGFAAETENMLESGQRKLEGKGMDFIVANDVGSNEFGFGKEHLHSTVIFKNGDQKEFGKIKKDELAAYIVEQASILSQQNSK